MGELTEGSIKKAAKEVFLKVLEAHNIQARIAEALVNTIEINLWRKVITGKADDVHVDFRLMFKGVKPEEIGEDSEIQVTLFELVDGKAVTELFSQSLLKALIRDGKVGASVEITEQEAAMIEAGEAGEQLRGEIKKGKIDTAILDDSKVFAEKVLDVEVPPHITPVELDGLTGAMVMAVNACAEPGGDETVGTVVEMVDDTTVKVKMTPDQLAKAMTAEKAKGRTPKIKFKKPVEARKCEVCGGELGDKSGCNACADCCPAHNDCSDCPYFY